MSKPLASKVSTPLSENVQIGTKVSILCGYPLFSSAALTLLGMEFPRASQVATGVFFHSFMTTSRSWWMLETLRSTRFILRMPHRCSLGFSSGDKLGQSITFTLSYFSKAVVILEVCFWSRYYVGILPCGPVSASVCHSTCWHSGFSQWTVAPQCRQHSCSPRPWHSHHYAWL